MRQEQKFSGSFAKNQQFEQYLAWMNDALAEKVKSLSDQRDLGEEAFPTLHIIGAPRSGTTMLTQLISSHLEVGYINNLIAAFWKAPEFGIQLSKKLLGLQYNSDFLSSYGRTNSIYEPHEFGYFWNYWLQYNDFHQQGPNHEEDIDWNGLHRQITEMTYAFDLPILFKSFLLGFHARRMHQVLPKTCFILVERNPLENAASILKMRKTLVGNIYEWVSMRPLGYQLLKDRNPYEQAIAQVLHLQREYKMQLETIPEKNRIYVQYEDVCDNPSKFLLKVQSMLTTQGADIKLRELPYPKLVGGTSKSDDQTMSNLKEALGTIESEMRKGNE